LLIALKMANDADFKFGRRDSPDRTPEKKFSKKGCGHGHVTS